MTPPSASSPATMGGGNFGGTQIAQKGGGNGPMGPPQPTTGQPTPAPQPGQPPGQMPPQLANLPPNVRQALVAAMSSQSAPKAM
jgi:hypothetical protein